MQNEALSLGDLAKARFPDLSAAEHTFLKKTEAGELADFRTGDKEHDDPAKATDWGPERVLRAEVINWLCLDKAARERVTDRGIGVFGARIVGGVNLNNVKFGRPLWLDDCALPGDFLCQDAQLTALSLAASKIGTLNADGIQVTGTVFLGNGFQAEGEVRLLGAAIGGALECDGGSFRNTNGDALNADSIQISGSMFLRGECRLEGEVSLVHAKALNFQYRELKAPELARLDLRDARFGTIWFDTASLPHRNKLWLHGMTYESIHDAVPTDVVWWLDFIERQTTESPDSERLAAEADQLDALNASKEARRRREQAESSRLPLPQPYEQAAKVLRAHGHAEDANAILIAKEDARGRAMSKRSFQWPWHLLSGLLIGYGYRPRRAVGIAFCFVLLGSGLFWLGDHYGLMRSVRVDGPAFVPVIYALETFTPLIKLKQADYWFPVMDTTWGTLLAWYGYFHTVAGWVLSTLLVAALTGLMRRP